MNELEDRDLLRNAVVVVTGSAGGLGRHLVKQLQQLDAQVVAIDRISASVDSERSLLSITQDLSREVDVRRVVDMIKERHSAVELLVNAAGAFLPDVAAGGIDSALESLWASNVRSAVHLTLGLQSLLAMGRDPLVVNIASTDAIVASAGQDCEVGVAHDVLYSTTKGALVSFTRALAMCWAKQHIRVNAICPTIFDSPMTTELLGIPGKKAALEAHIPLGRLCSTKDIGDAVIALYRLKMTTGHVLPVDGGYLCQ